MGGINTPGTFGVRLRGIIPTEGRPYIGLNIPKACEKLDGLFAMSGGLAASTRNPFWEYLSGALLECEDNGTGGKVFLFFALTEEEKAKKDRDGLTSVRQQFKGVIEEEGKFPVQTVGVITQTDGRNFNMAGDLLTSATEGRLPPITRENIKETCGLAKDFTIAISGERGEITSLFLFDQEVLEVAKEILSLRQGNQIQRIFHDLCSPDSVRSSSSDSDNKYTDRLRIMRALYLGNFLPIDLPFHRFLVQLFTYLNNKKNVELFQNLVNLSAAGNVKTVPVMGRETADYSARRPRPGVSESEEQILNTNIRLGAQALLAPSELRPLMIRDLSRQISQNWVPSLEYIRDGIIKVIGIMKAIEKAKE